MSLTRILLRMRATVTSWRWVAGAAVVVIVLYVSAVGAGWSDVLLDGQKIPVPDAWARTVTTVVTPAPVEQRMIIPKS